MDEVGVRELRNRVAAVVRRAGRGERVVITVDGRPTAQLGPLEPDRSGCTMADLVAAGLVDPPGRLDRPQPPIPIEVPVDAAVDRILADLRGR